MTQNDSFEQYGVRWRDFIRRYSGLPPGTGSTSGAPDAEFGQLAMALFALQFAHNAPFRAFCQARRVMPDSLPHWSAIPAMPTTAFKVLELTSLAAAERVRVFQSSGTTEQRSSRHFHGVESLQVYDASLWPWFARHLLPPYFESQDSPGLVLNPDHESALLCTGEKVSGLSSAATGFMGSALGRQPRAGEKLMLIILTPTPADAPHSSLVHMFDVVRRALGAGDSVFTGQRNQEGAWSVGVDATLEALREAIRLELPALLLGTAFSYVHLLDALVRHPLSAPLPAGSRALETGGYKGRSRALPRSELHGLIHRQLGIAPSHVVGEYGMCELSSQAYDRAAGGGEFQSSNFKWESRQESTAKSQISNLKSEVGKRVFRFPPWARVQIVSPENGLEVGEGGSGLIKVIDLANVRSVMAVLTEDLGLRRGGGFELVGRAALAEPRGCSLMTEAIP